MNKKITYDNELCLSEKELLAYMKGESDATLERRVELHVADCELCSDALDGLQSFDNQEFIKENQKIKQHIKHTFFEAKIISIFSKRNLSIAASVSALLFGFWWWNQNSSDKSIAQNENKEIPTIAEIKTDTAKFKVSEKEIIAMADENISPKKSKIKKEENSPILIEANNNTSSVLKDENIAVVPNTTTSTTVLAPTPSYNNDYAEKTLEKQSVQEEKKEDVAVKLKTTSDYNFFSDSLKKYDDAQKYVTHQNAIDFSKSRYPSIPAKDIVAKTEKTENTGKNKEQNPVKPSAKSKSNPKTNIEFSQAEDRLLNEGIQEYQKNRPKQAIAIFDKILAKNPDNENAIFYKGASQAIDNQCFEAVNTLNNFKTSYPEGSAANSEATWLIANCQLKLMQRESAILLLKQLAEFYNPRQDDAKKLLEKL